ncbi:MAG: hypothetical protein HN981_02145 [Candidatus Pacebacteria bacterium]|jgi:uncharacterized protein YkwD|nr:hypothetical protein [Candidatus Paceibacterota bacterium]MBT6921173.1 hypothetical protein [Candidatus Paceibacterota bacterium]
MNRRIYKNKRLLFFILLVVASVIVFFIDQSSNSSFNSKDLSGSTKSNEFKKCYLGTENESWIIVTEKESCDQKIKEHRLSEEKTKPTYKPIAEKKEVGSNDPWKVEKIDDKTTDTRFPADERMGTSEELFIAINNYRSSHSISQVQKHDTLCGIAQTRANQLLELGELDYHAGMDSLAHSQQDFDNMGEVISGGTQNELAAHTVEWGWGRSLTGHRESVLNPKWTHGCGGVAGLFSVFVFGSN